jgi:Cd2+/Zn2+-exporting ATPase
VAGIGRAAHRRILIKGGVFLERAGAISAVAFDKTGTLTFGKPQLTDVIALAPALAPAGMPAEEGSAPWPADERDVLRWAAIAEFGSEHPLARPILAEAAALGDIPHADTFEPYPGRGVRALYDGHHIVVGTVELMDSLGVELDAVAHEYLWRLRSEGKTGMLVALDGAALGILAVADRMRTEAPHLIEQLRKTGVKRIVMLTGDDRRTAEAIAAETGVNDVYAGLLPDDKLAAIRQLQDEGHVVAMAGDGINDAPALAAADIGIAMGTAGTAVAIETADIALMTDDLLKIAEAIRLSRATLRTIRQNMAIALLVVAGLLAGVLIGEVHMAGGMLIHELSVMVVIANAMRLLRA